MMTTVGELSLQTLHGNRQRLVAVLPARTRREPSRPLYDDNGRRIVTRDSARKSATIGSSPPSSLDSSGELSPRSSLDANRALRMSIDRSLKKEGLGQWSPESTTYSPIKKLTPLELQAQKKGQIAGYRRKVGGPKSGRVACEGMLDSSPVKPEARRRCHWVTPQSEPGLINYQDEVWEVPVHDDKLLFELLVLEGLQGELSHPQRRVPSAQPSRLLPYFPKHGVTCPPPPQSLARNADLVTQNPSSPASKATEKANANANARNPQPLPASRGTAHSVLASTKAAARNPSPTPASRATSRTQLSEKVLKASATNSSPAVASRPTACNPSPAPAPGTASRNSSPSPASRATARHSSPSPAPRTSCSTTRNPSPSPASRANPVGPSAKSPLNPPSNGKAGTIPSLRRPASPALTRREPSRPLYDDNGRRIVTPDSARKSAAIGSSPPSSLDSSGELSPRSSLDVNRALRMSIDRSLKKEGLGQWSPESTTYSPIKKLTPLELQAQKKGQIAGYGRKVGGPKSGRVACEGMLDSSPVKPEARRRCYWVTPQSEPGLINYHDEVWGVPVHDDKLLFELLVLEGLQGELSRPQILSMRDYFRDVFAGFDPEIVAKFDEKKVAALKLDEIIRQPEAKLRGVIDNAKQLLKITEEFGSFDKYLWNFVGFKPIVNSYHMFTQIPVKSSKSETLSKDLMRRGFRYVGPTTVYSFMQAAGMVNDHLVSCYRHRECSEISPIQPKDVNCSNTKGC